MEYFERPGPSPEKWKYTTGSFGPRTRTPPGAGLAYWDTVIDGLTVRYHSGIYSTNQDIRYQTPSFGWSMEVGTRIIDNGCVWEIVEATDAIRLEGASFCGFDSVATRGGNCGYAISQGENVTIDGNYFVASTSLAAFWISNGDMRFGEVGQFANQIRIGGAASLTGNGFGLLHDGGLGFTLDGNINFQLCPAGFMQLAGIYGGSITPGYIETTGGRMRNASYNCRWGGVQGIYGVDIGCGYAGSITGNYFLDCYDGVFSARVMPGGGAVAVFGGLDTCCADVVGRHLNNRPLSDKPVKRGRVLDLVHRAPTGTVTLISGVSPPISVALTTTSTITCTLKRPLGIASTVGYAARDTDRVFGAAGSFKLSALSAAGTVNTADGSTLDWVVNQ
jgi:hypothetical protein